MTDWSLAIRLEHEIARIITEQELNGWQFDVDLAHKHLAYLREEQDRIYENVRPHLSREVVSHGPVNKPFKMDGSLAAISERWADTVGSEWDSSWVSGPFSRVSFVEPDLGSRKKLMVQLERLGWKPLEYTEKGNPRLTESSLTPLSSGIGREIALWYVYGHRASLIESQLLPNVRADGRIPAGADPLGTNTGRMRHIVVVNIPKASPDVIFGRECRELFTVKPGYKLVGYDAKGLEFRMLAHLINDPEYTEFVVDDERDIHSYHQRLAGLPTRDGAKTFIYAFIYGGGDAKLGEILGAGRAAGKRIRASFLKSIPGLEAAVEGTQQEASRGFVTGLDGRRLWLRKGERGELKTHTALNVKLQGNGAIFMKTLTVFLDRAIKGAGLDATKVGDFHDEGQLEVREDLVDEVRELIHQSVVKTCNLLKVNVPMKADVMVGSNWAETH